MMASDPVGEPEDAGQGRKGSEMKTFLWCVLVASVLWLLISLNDNYSNILRVSIHYSNLPRNKVFVRQLPEEFKVAVYSKGWDLLAYALKGRPEDVYIDLREFKDQRYILSRRLKVNLQQQISQKITINDIYPDTIILETANALQKKVPVKVQLKLDLAKNFQLGDKVTFTPESVMVSGPYNEVKRIKSVNTPLTYLTGLEKPASYNLSLIKPSESNINYDINMVKVDVPVYELTEQEIELPVEILNTKAKIKLVPEKVKVIFRVTLNKYKETDATSFKAIVDGGKLPASKKLKVQLLSQPSFIYNLRISPEYVNFLIEQ